MLLVKIPVEITKTIKLPIIIIYGSQIPKGKEKYLSAFNIFELAIGIKLNSPCIIPVEDDTTLLPIMYNMLKLTPKIILLVVSFVFKDIYPIKTDNVITPRSSDNIIIKIDCPMEKLPNENKDIILKLLCNGFKPMIELIIPTVTNVQININTIPKNIGGKIRMNIFFR